MKILLIEDELKMAEIVQYGLRRAEYIVDHVNDGLLGLCAAKEKSYDLIVLDEMLPSLSGFQLLTEARQMGIDTPVIMVSARADLQDRLTGFRVGADDYLSKPFFMEELVARIKAVLLRRSRNAPSILYVGGILLDLKSRRAQWGDTSALLSQREFDLLVCLMSSPGHIFSRQEILKQVWRIGFDPQSNVVDVYIRRIKQKLARSTDTSLWPVESVRNVGYWIKRVNQP
jgi:DNA-binding response OmpR family regulator